MLYWQHMNSATWKLIAGIGLAVHALVLSFTHQTWWFMQNVNLIFHEAGHVVFALFGNTFMLLGGSLLEVIVPLSVTLQFLRQRAYFSAAFGCWWLHSALMSVSIYISDASARKLPLITGDLNTHDWFQLLLSWRMLQYDGAIGFLVWLFGLGAVAGIIFCLSKDASVKQLLHRH